MITRINEKWDPISWGWLSQNTFHTTSTVLVMLEPLVEFLQSLSKFDIFLRFLVDIDLVKKFIMYLVKLKNGMVIRLKGKCNQH